MHMNVAFDSSQWLRRQTGVILDLFEQAAADLEASGIRLLAGSLPPKSEDSDSVKKITLTPLRFSGSNGQQFLSLSLLATNERGAARYIVALEMAGPVTCQALQKLAMENADIWNRAYVRVGLWISEGGESRLLNDVSQITRSATSGVSLAGAFLHSDIGRTIQQGVMMVGLLYRSILDEIAGACKMRRLYAQLSRGVDYRGQIFQRLVRP